ncbi:hypothetical protein N7519_010653 [Penicillium mononematosum]|uniref:uncharacterized protein n=1 Tax=Penicillium mononematosum TaxID=268346 RepID=UPI0025484AEC|nr:uncharacterized protein N7519_010653 [Penicillium mononematosum]KAJ6180192.1 hypothetical protein N7519_010653 [Penicillium mononematosum]
MDTSIHEQKATELETRNVVDSGAQLMRDLRDVIATLIHQLAEIQREEDSDRVLRWTRARPGG